jgi:hypothetical protein
MPDSAQRFFTPIHLSLALAVLLVLIINVLIPYPAEPTDFSRLGMNCLLIEQQGWKYAVNDNWGFALPALSYALTGITGDLLLTQRLLSGGFALLAYWLVLQIFTRRLGGTFHWPAFAGALLLLFNFTFFILVISCHWDIVPITAVLFGIWKLQQLSPRNAFWVGLVVAAGYWFRFHFLGFALLYPVLVLVLMENRSWKVPAIVALGCAVCIALPHGLTLLTFGQFSLSNQAAVISEMFTKVNYDCDYERALKKLPVGDLLKTGNWAEVLRTFYKDLTFYLEISLFLIAFVSFLFTSLVKKTRLQWRFRSSTAKQIVWIAVYVSVCTLPFIFLRGITGRLLGAFLLPAFPLFLWLMCRYGRLMAGITLALILILPLRLSSHYSYYRNYARQHRQDFDMVSKHIPKTVFRDTPERVLITEYEFFLNPLHRYWLAAPALTIGISCRYEPFHEFFDRVKLEDLADPERMSRYDYLITPSPLWKESYWSFDTIQQYAFCPLTAHNEHIAIFRCD